MNPSAYPDPNDKTEIIIAVEPFEAMAGFRNAVVAREDIGRLTSLRPWLDRAAEGNGMRSLVTALFGFIAEESAAICEASKNELKDMAAARALRPAEELFLKLAQSYPGDRGALFAFLLNHIMLEPGEGCFLPPNSPHAYLNGVGIECMTNSDNVIRAGLTPKAVDVPTMLETLDFSRSGVTLMAPPAGGERRFVPPCASFEVWMLRDCALDLRRLPGRLMICAVLEGKARLRCGGNVIQAPCGTAWIRPAALSDGIIEAAETGAYVACATVQADNK